MLVMYVVAALALIAAGAMVGILVLAVVVIHLEDWAFSLDRPNPGPFASGVRAITGARVHPQFSALADHRRRVRWERAARHLAQVDQTRTPARSARAARVHRAHSGVSSSTP